jgi:regulator of replication initiation timing
MLNLINDIRMLCSEIGPLTTKQIINNLNDQGILYNKPAARERRLYKTAFRMLKYQNFETNTNKTGLTKIKNAFQAIKNNTIDKTMHYVPNIDITILNEIKEVDEEIRVKEAVHKFIKYEDLYTHSTKEMKTYRNHDKISHVNHVKSVNGKAKKKMSKELAELNKKKWKYDFIKTHELPELRAVLHDKKKFDDLAQIAASRRHFAMVVDRMAPWSTMEISDSLARIRDESWDENWDELRDMLTKGVDFEADKEKIQNRRLLDYDPEIMAQPDQFVHEVEVKHYEQVPRYDYKIRTRVEMVKGVKSVNHLGVKATPEAFDQISEEIYKISEMPGFGQLKIHWSGVRKRNDDLQKELSKIRERISQKTAAYQIRKAKKKKKSKQRQKKDLQDKDILRYFAFEEFEEFREVCREFDLIDKEAREMTKQECITEIKKDLIQIYKIVPKVNDICTFARYENLVGKTNIPAYALKRYQSILRAASLRENIYTSLNYHFQKRKKFRESKRLHNSGYEDY